MKNLQLDIGAPHEFMDFRYRLDDAEHGEFWLAHCGALDGCRADGRGLRPRHVPRDRRPDVRRDRRRHQPAAPRSGPIHRPPRVPAGRMPHCHWRIDIVAGDHLVEPHPNASARRSRSDARPAPDGRSPIATSGRAGPTTAASSIPDFRLEDCSLERRCGSRSMSSRCRATCCCAACCSSGHPAARVADRAVASLPRLVAGWGGLTAQRLRDALSLAADAEDSRRCCRCTRCSHPMTYVACRRRRRRTSAVRLAFGDCPACARG